MRWIRQAIRRSAVDFVVIVSVFAALAGIGLPLAATLVFGLLSSARTPVPDREQSDTFRPDPH